MFPYSNMVQHRKMPSNGQAKAPSDSSCCLLQHNGATTNARVENKNCNACHGQQSHSLTEAKVGKQAGKQMQWL